MTHAVIWVTEGSWRSCVRVARDLLPADADVTLLHVADTSVPAAASGAFTGLFGRGHAGRDPGILVAQLAGEAAEQLLSSAAEELGRHCERALRRGRLEREVVHAVAQLGADLLVLARDGDRSRLGPHSLGSATRFVVDHAPCQVLLLWPESVPEIGSIPPPPPGAHPPVDPPPHPHEPPLS